MVERYRVAVETGVRFPPSRADWEAVAQAAEQVKRGVTSRLSSSSRVAPAPTSFCRARVPSGKGAGLQIQRAKALRGFESRRVLQNVADLDRSFKPGYSR